MRIGDALRRLKDQELKPTGFLRKLADGTGIEYSRIRKLAANQANATTGEVLAIQGFLKLEANWYKATPEAVSLEGVSTSTVLSLIDAISTEGTPQAVRSGLADELKRVLKLK